MHKIMPLEQAGLGASEVGGRWCAGRIVLARPESGRSRREQSIEQGQAQLLGDGGAGFLHRVQGKAEFNSTFWTAGAAIIAAFGGGKLSVDYRIGREF